MLNTAGCHVREIDLQKSAFDLTEERPELIPLLREQGLLGVADALMRNTIGRVTTIPQGCQKKGKDQAELTRILEAKGFTVKNRRDSHVLGLYAVT